MSQVNITGLEMPVAWITTQPQDSNFDISADQLNNVADRTVSVRGGSIDWSGGTPANRTLHTECLDPVSAQDLVTLNFYNTNLPQAGHIIENDLTPLAQETRLNFAGDLVSATAQTGFTDVKITSGLIAKGDLLTFDSQLTALPLAAPAAFS